MAVPEIVAVLAVLALVLGVALAVAVYAVVQSHKRKKLRSTFGPEYDRAVGTAGRRAAERELAEREEHRRTLDIRPLPEPDRRAFAARWRSAQQDFVDSPEMAVRQADLLVTEVMAQRGYPVGDFEQMSRDVSVDHAGVVGEYRAAHDISELNDVDQASTEQLRQAMVHYRALFDDLLSTGADDVAADRDSVSREEAGSFRDASEEHDPRRDDRPRT